MALWSDLVNAVFERLAVIRPGETITGSLQTSAFLAMQQRWALNCLEKTFTTAWYHQTLALSAGTSAYTFGTGGTLVATVAPIQVVSWRSVSGGFETGGPVISFEEFEATVKNPNAESAILAKVVAADGGYPSKALRIFPVPATAPGSLILDYFGAMTQPSTVSDAVSFGPGYENFIINDSALELYSQYARSNAMSLKALQDSRQNALQVITALNARILGLQAAPQPAG